MDSKARLQQLIIQTLYSDPVLNNAHRGDFVELMVLDALGAEWRHVGLGWNLWDLQRGSGKERARIQVKQSAALQRSGKTKHMMFQCRWRDGAPSYIRRDFPSEALEQEGWFCELFVVGVHSQQDLKLCDQTDPSQWRFLVVPSRDLPRAQKTMLLDKAVLRWPLVSLTDLKAVVDSTLDNS